MNERQVFILLWVQEQEPAPKHVGVNTRFPDELDKPKVLRDVTKGEDLCSLTKKLDRMVARGWLESHRPGFYSLTEKGQTALETATAQRHIRTMTTRYEKRRDEWNKGAGR